MTFKEFLESTPKDSLKKITDLIYYNPNNGDFILNMPDIAIFCDDDKCNGIRIFRHQNDNSIYQLPAKEDCFVKYICSNCQKTQKTYSLYILIPNKHPRQPHTPQNGYAYKYGEFPVFAPHTPSRVFKIIGPDREMFLKGRRAESQGLGIGAFAYYRRVIENQKHRIFDEIIKVAGLYPDTEELVSQLKQAKTETQFTKSVEDVKKSLPQSLLLNGHNPLTLLHSALSEGLHAKSDEECLELATAVRVVLAELAERLSEALKDEKSLNDAVTKLIQTKTAKNSK
ncbi:MAG: hypothetical protein KJ017_04435 [Alphaproteobacteria bacterium]|nr:hypothetical protein [Alphaproteobacteria bacterium]